ncbi:AIR carboxylase family protein, partial [Helicobacter japonicus]
MDFVSVIMGSKSDWSVMSECIEVFKKFDVAYEVIISSAHRSPERTKSYIKDAQSR